MNEVFLDWLTRRYKYLIIEVFFYLIFMYLETTYQLSKTTHKWFNEQNPVKTIHETRRHLDSCLAPHMSNAAAIKPKNDGIF